MFDIKEDIEIEPGTSASFSFHFLFSNNIWSKQPNDMQKLVSILG